MENNQVLDIIISFINALNTNKIISEINCRQYIIKNVDYLLNQIIRQYVIDDDHYYVSKRARDTWTRLTSKRIGDFYYKEIIKCENDVPIKVKFYKNNSNNYEEKELKKGDKFSYRSIFHNEHIIPIKVIIGELKKLKEPNYHNVEEILNKIYVCRMLKEEDRSIKAKSNRPFDVNEVKKRFYEPEGIEILNVKK